MSGVQAVALLTQLVNISTGAPISGVEQNSPPFQPPASIVRVNVMWFLSLVLSLSCALLTTSMQQSARVYLDYAQHRDAPRMQAQIREYMFEGAEHFRLSLAVGTMPFLLHISVFLFFAGLIDFLLTINTVVAFSTLGLIVVCALIYTVLTLSPILRPNCPYRTPLSGFTYFSFHFSASGLFWAANTIEGIFHGFLLELWRYFHPDVWESPDHGPTKWKEILQGKVDWHYEGFLYGLQQRVVNGAMKVPPSARALYWTLTTLDEDKEFEEFAARMPGFFDSSADADATSAMLFLMSEQPTSDPILGTRLRELLGSCRPGASPLTEEQRSSRLRVCLTSLWYCLREFNLPKNSKVPLPPYVRTAFATPQVLSWIQTEDLPTRLLGRCFGLLVTKKLAKDIDPHTLNLSSIPPPPELTCMSYILGVKTKQVQNWLEHKGDMDLANLVSHTSGEFETLVANVTVTKGDVVDVFQQTLDILAEGMVSSQAYVRWDTDQTAQFQEVYFKLKNASVPDALKIRLRYISDSLPRPKVVPKMEMPVPKMKMPVQRIRRHSNAIPDSARYPIRTEPFRKSL